MNYVVTDIPKNIPEHIKEKYKAITSMIHSFCSIYLDKDYEELCIHALQKLCQKRNEPLKTGSNNMWAAGIVYAIAQNCGFIGNKSYYMTTPKYHLAASEIAVYFGVSKGGVYEKAKIIKDKLNIKAECDEWVTENERGNGGRKLIKMLRGL